jgi:hypothetical protein
MLRTIITPVTTQVNLSIPKEYLGKEVEILLFSTDETEKKQPVKKMQWQKYKGILSARRAKEMQKYVEKSRKEWERNI